MQHRLDKILAEHEGAIHFAHQVAASQLIDAFTKALAVHDLHRHSIRIGAHSLLIGHIVAAVGLHRIARGDGLLAQTLRLIDGTIAESAIPNRYFGKAVLNLKKVPA